MAELRLIDANALNVDVANEYVMINDADTIFTPAGAQIFNAAIDMALSKIRQAPTIDAVPVVRCVECIHRCTDCCPMCHEEYYYDEDDGGDWVTRDMTVDDGFCHKGEKMDGGAEE